MRHTAVHGAIWSGAREIPCEPREQGVRQGRAAVGSGVGDLPLPWVAATGRNRRNMDQVGREKGAGYAAW